MMRKGVKKIVRPHALVVARRALALLPRNAARRRVLFVCSHELQAEYLADVWNLLKPDPRIESRLLMPRFEHHTGEYERVHRWLPIPEIRDFWARAGRWDLIVLAEHVLKEFAANDRQRILRISHGFPGKRVNGVLHAFGPGSYAPDGRIRYTRMFVPSGTVKEWAVRTNPAFEKIVSVVGSPSDDRMLAQVGRREEFRSRFGFKPGETVVFVTGTWGPYSLFHRMGDALLAKARELQGEFRFILSVHSLEYQRQPTGGRIWGEYLRAQRQHGFIVREPWEDWTPYMIAGDIILTDHTSLAVHGALLGRPFVWSQVPDELVEAGTVLRQIRDLSPQVRTDAADLREALVQAQNHYPFDRLREIASQMNSCPHRAQDRMHEELYTLLSLPPRPAAESLQK